MASERDPLGEALVEEKNRLKFARSNWENTWQSTARYVLPREATFTVGREHGTLRNRHVLDSTATTSLVLFGSSLHTLMNNPSFKWFRLGIEGVERPTRVQRRWLEQVEMVMLNAMSRRESNVYNLSHKSFIGLGAFGTAVSLIEGGSSGLSMRSYGLQHTYLREGASGEIDSVFRSQMFDARQAAQRFGAENLSADVASSLERPSPAAAMGANGDDGRHAFLHAVFPSDDPSLARYLPDQIRFLGVPYVGVWVDERARRTMQISIYFEFPYVTPRWYLTDDEMYGRGPGMDVLPDVRMANRMKEAIVRGAEKLVDPPLAIPDGGILSPVRTYPGGLNYTDGEINIQPLIPPGASRIEVGDKLLQDTQQAIRTGFFNSLFASEDDSPVRTATEVLQRQGERNRALSPMLVRLHTEFYDPLILRTFAVLQRQGMLPEPPPDLTGAPLTAQYISPLSASQGEAEALAVQRWFEQLAPWSQVDPGVFDYAGIDDVAQLLGERLGVPSQLIRSQQEVDAVRAARQAQIKKQQAAEAAQVGFQGAEAAAKLIAAQRPTGG